MRSHGFGCTFEGLPLRLLVLCVRRRLAIFIFRPLCFGNISSVATRTPGVELVVAAVLLSHRSHCGWSSTHSCHSFSVGFLLHTDPPLGRLSLCRGLRFEQQLSIPFGYPCLSSLELVLRLLLVPILALLGLSLQLRLSLLLLARSIQRELDEDLVLPRVQRLLDLVRCLDGWRSAAGSLALYKVEFVVRGVSKRVPARHVSNLGLVF
mmetsp:Transcript_90901/g.190062  ORF Transcript_90901/g.190062 Transcript_90901/m.190062 type:complete len:208 (-) Transcript_90901:9-632(-)